MRGFKVAAALCVLSLTATAGAAHAGEKARATWYGAAYAGKRTASGELFNPKALTAAHPTLPLGSLVEVRRLTSDRKNTEPRKVVVRITDRCPCGPGRIDLSEAAARALRIRDSGVGMVEINRLPQLAQAR